MPLSLCVFVTADDFLTLDEPVVAFIHGEEHLLGLIVRDSLFQGGRTE